MKEVTAIITQEKAKVSCNFGQVKEAISETLAEYKGAVFTEDSKAYAKKHVASLRKQKKAFQDNLRDEKEKYMEPWNEFEDQAKELIAMYDDPINLINGQVQAFEEDRIAKKKELISKIYGEMVSAELAEYIPLSRNYNKKWENATTKEKDIRKEIHQLIEKTRQDISMICGMDSDAEKTALGMYKANPDITAAISYINSYERQKQEIIAKEKEKQRREKEERIRQEEREKALVEQRTMEEKEAAARWEELEKEQAVEQAKKEATQEFIDSLIPDAAEESELYQYRIALSTDAKNKLEMYMDSIGIEWEVIS